MNKSDGAGGVPADGIMRAADGTPLKDALRRSQAVERRRAFSLVAPLLFFILIVFAIPIVAMIWRSVYNPEIRVNEKPLAEKRLLDGMREGASLINYIGHGNNTTWTHEYLFNSSKHFNLLPGNNRPAIYIAATCSWRTGSMRRPRPGSRRASPT